MRQGEADFCVGESEVVEFVNNMSEFCVVAFQEFSAGRNVEEEIPDLERDISVANFEIFFV